LQTSSNNYDSINYNIYDNIEVKLSNNKEYVSLRGRCSSILNEFVSLLGELINIKNQLIREKVFLYLIFLFSSIVTRF
jgi:hypothetical protein